MRACVYTNKVIIAIVKILIKKKTTVAIPSPPAAGILKCWYVYACHYII